MARALMNGVKRRLRRALGAGFAMLVLAGVGVSMLAPTPAEACCSNTRGEHDGPQLPDNARVQFREPGGRTFYPRRLLLIGPNAGLSAALPRRSDLHDENRLPLSGLGSVGPLFEDRPLLDRIGRGMTLGRLYRRGDALVVVFASEGAYRDALWRLRHRVGLITRLSRGRGLASMRLKLDFRPLSRQEAKGRVEGRAIGVAHGAGPTLILAPPASDLPRNNIF